jgi:hypothetical protein
MKRTSAVGIGVIIEACLLPLRVKNPSSYVTSRLSRALSTLSTTTSRDLGTLSVLRLERFRAIEDSAHEREGWSGYIAAYPWQSS